jgi:hypothetical protein
LVFPTGGVKIRKQGLRVGKMLLYLSPLYIPAASSAEHIIAISSFRKMQRKERTKHGCVLLYF